MADNNPTPWPPAPQTGEAQTAKKPANRRVGWASLGLAVFLLVIELVTLLAVWTAGDGPKILGIVIHSSLGLLGLSIGAIVTGIGGRQSLPGKLGIFVSLVNLAVYAYLLNEFQHLAF